MGTDTGVTAMAHAAAVRAIAEEFKRPPDEVAALYRAALADLAPQAAVAQFLPVLAGKRVRALYRQRLASGADSARAGSRAAGPGPPVGDGVA